MTTKKATQGPTVYLPSSTRPAKGAAGRIGVLHLNYSMAYGGVDETIINWVRKMDRDRFEPHLACFAIPGALEMPFVKAVTKAGLTITGKLPWRRSKPVFSAARALRDLIRQHQIDIVHSHQCYADVVTMVAGMMTPVKLVTTLYVWGDFGWKRNLIQWINQLAIRRFDLIAPHCQDAVEDTIARGIKREKVKLLISGFEADSRVITAEERRQRRQERGVTDKEVVLANVARFYPEKVQAGLLRSFREISERRPEARLWFMGAGPLEPELRRLSSALGLDERVSFLGFVEDVPGVLPLADIQVHPSQNEGVALAVCAGMAAGLPVVASDVGGLKEVLKHERTGILVPAGDERAFAQAVIGLLGDRDRARRLGDAARRFIEDEYSLGRAVDELQNTYEELVRKCA